MDKIKRINSKKIFLTYSNISLSKESVLEQLQAIIPIKEYIIAKEYNTKEQYHIHALIVAVQKVDILINKLDLKDQNQLVHGNYQPVRNFKACVNYLKKENDYITNIEIDDESDILKVMKEMVEEQGEKGIESAMSYYSTKIPQKVPKNYASIKKISKKVKNFLIPN
jgi:hypothetical protein